VWSPGTAVAHAPADSNIRSSRPTGPDEVGVRFEFRVGEIAPRRERLLRAKKTPPARDRRRFADVAKDIMLVKNNERCTTCRSFFGCGSKMNSLPSTSSWTSTPTDAG